jgi:flagellar protein FlgJ
MTTTPAPISFGASPILASTTAPVAVPAAANDREQLAGVAKQFEAIFVRQMMAAARKTNFAGEDGLFSSGQGMQTFQQMQDERFADIAADTGAFGLAKMIEAHLARFVSAASDTSAAASADKEASGHVL